MFKANNLLGAFHCVAKHGVHLFFVCKGHFSPYAEISFFFQMNHFKAKFYIEKSATTSSEAVLELSGVAALQLIEVPWLSTALNMLFPDRWEEAEVYIQFFRCQSTLTPLRLVNLA